MFYHHPRPPDIAIKLNFALVIPTSNKLNLCFYKWWSAGIMGNCSYPANQGKEGNDKLRWTQIAGHKQM